jgi:photosystem II stability/assembly factor-like uncharacterized protein
MKIDSKKFLVVFLLVALSACVPGELGQNASPSPLLSTLPPDTAYPSPVLPRTVAPSNPPTSQQPLAPSLTPSRLPSPTLTTTPILRVSQLRMFDASSGWAGYSEPYFPPKPNKILRTMDGIRTWMDVTPPISEQNTDIGAVFFLDADRAIVVSRRSYLPESTLVEVTPWLTSDGGQTWQAGETFQLDRAAFFYPIQLSFLDPDQGWMLGESDGGMGNTLVYFFETRDGGLHWEMVYDTADHLSDSHDIWMNGIYPYPNHFTFVSKTGGFFSDGRLYSSQDGGRYWKLQPLEPPAELPELNCKGIDCKYVLDLVSAPRFSSQQDGVLVRRVYLNSKVVRDFVESYQGIPKPWPFPAVQYIYFTHDGGRTWVPRSAPVVLGTTYFLDAEAGWLLGKSEPDPAAQAQLYQTTDGGKTWTQVSAECPLSLGSEMQFVDPQTGFAFFPSALADFYRDFDARIQAAEKESTLFYTEDGGRSWTEVAPGIDP